MIVADPTPSAEVVKLTVVPELNDSVSRVVDPSMKLMDPVGVPAPGALAVTVAVKVTDWPNTMGLTEEVRAVLVESWLTACERAAEVLVVKLPSPP